MRLIDADKFLAQIEDQYMEHDITRAQYLDLENRILEQPTVDAVPVRHGQWKAVTDDGDEYIRICSCCGEEAPYDDEDEGPLSEGYYLLYPHCPWCGAKMDGKDGDQA